MFLSVPTVALTVGLLVVHGCSGMEFNRYDPNLRPNFAQQQNQYHPQGSLPPESFGASAFRSTLRQQPAVSHMNFGHPTAYYPLTQSAASNGQQPPNNAGLTYPSQQMSQQGYAPPSESNGYPYSYFGNWDPNFAATLYNAQQAYPNVGANIYRFAPYYHQQTPDRFAQPSAATWSQSSHPLMRDSPAHLYPSAPDFAPTYHTPGSMPIASTVHLSEVAQTPEHPQHVPATSSQDPFSPAFEVLDSGSSTDEDTRSEYQGSQQSSSNSSDEDYVPSDSEGRRKSRPTRKEDRLSRNIIKYQPWNKQRQDYTMKLCRKHQNLAPLTSNLAAPIFSESELASALRRIKKLRHNRVELLPSEIQTKTLRDLRTAIRDHAFFYIILWDNEQKQAYVWSPYRIAESPILDCDRLQEVMKFDLHFFKVITEPMPQNIDKHMADVGAAVDRSQAQR